MKFETLWCVISIVLLFGNYYYCILLIGLYVYYWIRSLVVIVGWKAKFFICIQVYTVPFSRLLIKHYSIL